MATHVSSTSRSSGLRAKIRAGPTRRPPERPSPDRPWRGLRPMTRRPMIRGVRARLTATIVALVVLTAGVLGIGSYLFVDSSLHRQALDEAADQARFGPLRDRAEPARCDPADRETRSAAWSVHSKFRGLDTIIDAGPDAVATPRPRPGPRDLPADCCSSSTRARSPLRGRSNGRPSLVVGGRSGGSPVRDLLHPRRSPARAGRSTSFAWRSVSARSSSRSSRSSPRGSSLAASSPRSRPPAGRPSGSSAATSRPAFRSRLYDEFRARGPTDSTGWPTPSRRRSPGSRPPRPRTGGSSPTCHELRTPVSALVAEASILRDHLNDLPRRRADARRARRHGHRPVLLSLRLMELSRPDAEGRGGPSHPTPSIWGA